VIEPSLSARVRRESPRPRPAKNRLLLPPAVGDNAAMQTESQRAEPRKRKRRWFQFSLRTLLIGVAIVAIPCAWLGKRIEQKRMEREEVAAIVKLRGSVLYDYQNVYGGKPRGPEWLRSVLGDDFFSEVDHVILTGTNAGDTELEHLTALTRFRTLWLGGTKVTNAGLEHLEGLRELRQLGLHSTNVNDAGLVCLKALTQLETLDLTKTRISDAGVKDLQIALPKCRIDH
jgi:hypothetical protein